MRALDEPTVIVSAAVGAAQRDQLERMAREGERTLSQEIRRAVREHLARHVEHADEEEAMT